MDSQRLAVATSMAVMFALLAFLLVAIDWAGANGRLRRNQWVKCLTTRLQYYGLYRIRNV
jgi:hypothetical protein